jgi:LPXTG-motif cell wall-anchored protein
MGFFDTPPSSSSGRPLPSLVTPINFGNLAPLPTGAGSTSSTAQTSQTAQTATQQTGGTSSWGSLDSILGIATQGAQIAGAVNYQRQQSGASARRQSRVAQCGRAPLIGRRRKEEYRKCIAEYNAGTQTPIVQTGGGDVNKGLGNDGDGNSSMKFVLFGLAIALVGGVGYLLYKKSK